MKKTIRKVALCLAVLGMGMSVSSCGINTSNLTSKLQNSGVMTTLGTVLKNIAGTTTTKNYSGKATSQSMYAQEDNWIYINKSQTNSFTSQAVSVATKKSTSGSYATITIPAYTDGSATISAINLYNLSVTTSSTTNSMAICDNSSIDGTFTYNGKSYSAGSLYITKAQQTSTGLTLECTIYFSDGSNYTHAVNYTYTGTASN